MKIGGCIKKDLSVFVLYYLNYVLVGTYSEIIESIGTIVISRYFLCTYRGVCVSDIWWYRTINSYNTLKFLLSFF